MSMRQTGFPANLRQIMLLFETQPVQGKMFKLDRQRESPQFSIKSAASLTTPCLLTQMTPTTRCSITVTYAVFSLVIKYILYICTLEIRQK